MEALFRCCRCEHTYEDELPDDPLHIEAWPVHCGEWANLVELAGEERIRSPRLRKEARLPFPGLPHFTEEEAA